MSEKLCLKWNDFKKNVCTSFGTLRDDKDFSDVTLACEDGKQMEAHKVILAASSPFFQNLLRQNKHPHPLIYMRGIKSEDLMAIVDFLYYGEANVYQENIDAFLAIAEELNLKGLTRNTNDSMEEPPETKKAPHVENKAKKNITRTKFQSPKLEPILNTTELIIETDPTETALTTLDESLTTNTITNIQELDQAVKSMMAKSQSSLSNVSNSKASQCTVCGKEGWPGSIKDHIEANHLEGVSIPCDFCEKTFRSRAGLRQHNSKHH